MFKCFSDSESQSEVKAHSENHYEETGFKILRRALWQHSLWQLRVVGDVIHHPQQDTALMAIMGILSVGLKVQIEM